MEIEEERSSTNRKHKKTPPLELSLESEARVLSPLLHRWREQTCSHIQEYDLVGAFILANLAKRKAGRYLSGEFKSPIVSHEDEEWLWRKSRSIGQFDGLVDVLGGVAFLERKFASFLAKTGKIEVASIDVPIAVIFNRFSLTGVKANKSNYVNNSIVQWTLGRLPFRLMFDIPSPMGVLGMQAAGERVITLFTTEQDLSKEHIGELHYMGGSKVHARDALAFLMHDMKHMEHFKQKDIFEEQVGFFRAFVDMPKKFSVENDGNVLTSLEELFLTRLEFDIQLWRELEYLISDMNCYATHLVQYLVAKVKEAEVRCPMKTDDKCRCRLEQVLIALGIDAESSAFNTLVQYGAAGTKVCNKAAITATSSEPRIGVVDEDIDGIKQYTGGILDCHQGDEIRAFFRGIGLGIVTTDEN